MPINQVDVCEKAYGFLQRNNNRVRFNYLWGGAASGKSWSIADFLIIEKFVQERGAGILAVRKTRPEVRASCLRLIETRLNHMGVPYDINKSELVISNARGNKIFFDGVDDVVKKKSFEGINYIWMEEVTELTRKEFLQLNLRCRAHNMNGINQIYCSFNPEDPVRNEWLKQMVDAAEARDDSAQLHLTHIHNPFLSNEEREQIEQLADTDAEYDKIYRQGQWATPTQIIYTNWDIVKAMPEQYDDAAWGLDFGYSVNPAALVEVRFAGKDLYVKEHVYQTHLTTPELIDKAKQIIGPEQLISADAAEPKAIDEMRMAGLNCVPCDKGPDSVRYGINTVRRFNLHITEDSPDVIKELRGYKWKQDNQGNVLDKPVPFRDHAMDALRYIVTKQIRQSPAGFSWLNLDYKKPLPEDETERELAIVTDDEYEDYWDDM